MDPTEIDPQEESGVTKDDEKTDALETDVVVTIIDNNSCTFETSNAYRVRHPTNENNQGEVGVAELDVVHPIKLTVSQITDDRSYSLTMERLRLLNPKEILVPDSHFGRPLAIRLRQVYSVRVSALHRGSFNETKGGEIINDLAKAQIMTKQHLHSHYLGRAAASALVSFAERSRGGETIKRLVVELDPWIGMQGRMRMDSSTIKSLELILNRRSSGKEGTLFSALKHTRTSMGARLLRGQIISPPADRDVINGRLDAVDECLTMIAAGEENFNQAREALKQMCDLDRVCSRFSSEPKRFTIRELKGEIEAILNTRSFTEQLKIITQVLVPLQSELWTVVNEFFTEREDWLNDIVVRISEVTAQPSQTTKTISHLQDLFCIKAQADGLLDAARLAYVQIVKNMEDYVESLREDTGLRGLELRRTSARGYHLSVPRSCENRLPTSFVQAVRHRKTILCTTAALASLNNRQARLETEILTLTVARLRPLREYLAGSLSELFKISEMVALIDMLLCFVHVSDLRSYVRPVLSNGEIRLVEARHPILNVLTDVCDPRDIYLGPEQRLLIVTGENCSGKTTILTHLGLTSIMVQLGCFVPAKECTVPIFSRICTRLATDDALEENASTFSLEMVETASILQALERETKHLSLILIDELGRGTSTRDGLAIATATAEHILNQIPAKCLFATHLLKMRVLTSIYPEFARALIVHPPRRADNPSDEPTMAADLENDDYGIRIAEQCAMPAEIINTARRMRQTLADHFATAHKDTEDVENVETNSPVEELFKVLKAIKDRTQTKPNSEIDFVEARRLLSELRAQLL